MTQTAIQNPRPIRMSRPLTMDEIVQAAPSVMADRPHSSRSDRFDFIPSIKVLEALMARGFHVFSASQTAVRTDASRVGYTRHMLRLRQDSAAPAIVGDVFPELCFTNGADGTTVGEFLAGVFRLACSNGMVVSEAAVASVRVKHIGEGGLQTLLSAADEVADRMQGLSSKVQLWQSLDMTKREQQMLAFRAAQIRFGDDRGRDPEIYTRLLDLHRSEDAGRSLWTVFNRVQENVLKGGFTAPSANGRRRRVRAINGLDQDMRVNRELWDLGERAATYLQSR